MRIDLNADVGESYGAWSIGQDEALIPLVTSINVACGAHAGDPATIERTIRLGRDAGVTVGAHPGYPDLAGFGRRDIDMAPADLEASVLYQLAAVQGICRALGVEMRHAKPHGALYNRAARDASVAEPLVRALVRLSPELVLVAPPGSVLLQAGRAAGLSVAAEGFADRAYEADGSLRSRRLPGAVHGNPSVVAAQAVGIARDGYVTAWDGSRVPLAVDTLCIHGDGPDAVAFAQAARLALAEAGIEVRGMSGRA